MAKLATVTKLKDLEVKSVVESNVQVVTTNENSKGINE